MLERGTQQRLHPSLGTVASNGGVSQVQWYAWAYSSLNQCLARGSAAATSVEKRTGQQNTDFRTTETQPCKKQSVVSQ